MIELLINNTAAVLPDGFSMELIYENPYFTKSSNYSLEVELPMPANHHIFGSLHRLQVKKEQITLPATLYHKGLKLIDGSAVVLYIDNKSIKIQLLSGNSEFNFITSEEYVDELDLGEVFIPKGIDDKYFDYDNAQMKNVFPSVDHGDALYLPIQYNDETAYPFNKFLWGTTQFRNPYASYWNYMSVQPYLVPTIHKIIRCFNYSVESNYLADTWMKNIFIVNGDRENVQIAKALPHWTIAELIDEVEKLFSVILVVSQENRSISFVDINTYFDVDYYPIDDVVDSYTVDISEELNKKDVSTGNVRYDIPSNTDGGYERLGVKILDNASIINYETYSDMYSAWQSMNAEDKLSTIFVLANRYYINYTQDNGTSILRNVNLYADYIRDKESDDYSTLKIVPAKINMNEVNIYDKIFMEIGVKSKIKLNFPYANDSMEHRNSDEKINIQSVIEGETEIYEKPQKNYMEIAIYTGDLMSVQIPGLNTTLQFPIPFIDYTQKVDGQTTDHPPYSLCLNDESVNSLGYRIAQQPKINSNIEYTIYFKANQIPPINKVFLINNQKYLAKQFKVNVINRGLEKIIEGVFYRID